MLGDLVDKKYPSITVQGVLLTSSVLYLEHGGANIAVIATVVFILSLFVLQSINHRFYYYFPGNKFIGTETKSIDTYILYGMTFAAFFTFIWGVSNSLVIGVISSVFIIFPGFLWRMFIFQKVRDKIAENLSKENKVKFIRCPNCGGKAILGRKVFKWNQGYEIVECLDGCGHKKEGHVPLNIG